MTVTNHKKQLREERLALVGSLRGDSTSEWRKQGGQGCLCQGGKIWWCLCQGGKIFLTSPLSGSRGIIQDWAITSRLHPSDLVPPTSPYVLKALYLPPNTPAHGKQLFKHRSIWWTCHFQTITPINGWLMGSCFQACNLMSDELFFFFFWVVSQTNFWGISAEPKLEGVWGYYQWVSAVASHGQWTGSVLFLPEKFSFSFSFVLMKLTPVKGNHMMTPQLFHWKRY